MVGKRSILFVSLFVALLLTACSTIQAGLSSGTQGSTRSDGVSRQGGQSFNATPEMRLAIGILKLEGTDKAVTAEQAKTLLPLWKGMRAEASTKESYPQAEVDGLNKQIRAALTPDQVTAIDGLDLSQQNLRTVFSSLGLQAGGGQNDGGTSGNGQSQTGRTQSSGTQNGTTGRQTSGQGTTGRTFSGGDGIGAGGFSGGGFAGGGFGGGTQTGSGTRSSAQGSGSSQVSVNTAHRLPTALLNAVVELLTRRAAA